MKIYLQLEIDKLVNSLKDLDPHTQDYAYAEGKIGAYADVLNRLNKRDERFNTL